MAVDVMTERQPQPSLVTEVRLRLLEDEKDGLVGFASCVLLGGFYLNNIAIRRGRDSRLFLTYPASPSRGGAEHHHWNPINAEAAGLLEEAILGRLRTMEG
jgi:DNA-binding cell septation regulator SpoVG